MRSLFDKTLLGVIIIHMLMFLQIDILEKTINFEMIIPVLVGIVLMLIAFKLSSFGKMDFIKKRYMSWFGYASGYCLGFLYVVIISL
ncbi:MAG: hypothetical protein ACRC30_01015 [Clostridium sp.]